MTDGEPGALEPADRRESIRPEVAAPGPVSREARRPGESASR